MGLVKRFICARQNVVIVLDLVTSLGTIYLSAIYFPNISWFHFPLWLSRISLFICTTFSLSISWWTTNWFCFLALVNTASKNMDEQLPLWEGILPSECAFRGCIVESSRSSFPALSGTFSVISTVCHFILQPAVKKECPWPTFSSVFVAP